MKPPMLHTAYKANTSRNAYGDYSFTTGTALACHFRYITDLVTGDNQQIQSDALAWFMPDSGVVKGDIIKFDNEYWMVERVTKARKLRDPNVQFIKCELFKYGVIS